MKIFFYIFILFNIFNNIENDRKSYPIERTRVYGGNWLGYYYINVYVGTPPQRQSLILDTGSSITAFPCTTCKENLCGKHFDKHFNISKSNTSSQINCSEKVIFIFLFFLQNY